MTPIDSHGDRPRDHAYDCSSASYRILIVDDNPEDVVMLEAFLDQEASSIRAAPASGQVLTGSVS